MTLVRSIFYELKGDKAIWIVVSLLALCSFMAVYSATGSIAYRIHGSHAEGFLVRQLVFMVLGFALMYICYLLKYMKYAQLAPFMLIASIVFLFLTLSYGESINGARRWWTIPWIDQTIQPSEFAKFALIVFVAKSLAVKQDIIKGFKSAFLPIILPVVVICGLILPADFSTAALLFITCLIMMFVGRVSLKYIFLLLLSGVVMVAIVILLAQVLPEGVVRLDTWISRFSAYFSGVEVDQIEQSKIAIANGGWFGVGPGNSIQRNYLPEAYADCIYAIICEEYGLVGGVFVLGLYMVLFYRTISLVTRCPKAFGALLAFGLCLSFVIQALANVGVAIGLLPATGLTLPLISVGGTSILVSCISIGVILSVSKFVEEAEEQKMQLEELEQRDANSF